MPPRRRREPTREVALAPLQPLESFELSEYDEQEKRAEALALSLRGYTNLQISERFGVHRNSISNWLRKARQEYRSRLENADEMIGETIAVYEQVMVEAWKAHEAVDKDQLSGANYLRIILDAAEKRVKLAGLDQPDTGAAQKTEVVVQIGGQGVRVGVRAS